MAAIKMLILDVDGTMTDAGIYITDDGRQFKKYNARDGIGVRMAMRAGVEVGIISHSMSSEMVETRGNMLGMKYVYVGDRPKVDVLNEWLTELKLNPENIAYIGDDVNDLDIMKIVGLTACPFDAVDEVKGVVDIQLSKKGGEGCVREFIDNHLL